MSVSAGAVAHECVQAHRACAAVCSAPGLTCPALPCPAAECWAMPHLIHVAVSAVAIVAFITMASIFTMAEVELNPASHNLLGMAHSK